MPKYEVDPQGILKGNGQGVGEDEVLYWDGAQIDSSPSLLFHPDTLQLVLGTGTQLLLPDGSAAVPAIQAASGPGWYFTNDAARFTFGGNQRAYIGNPGIGIADNSYYGWFAGDLFLVRDAANTLAMRNSTNPQSFRIYNTYTDASNFETFKLAWVGNNLYIQTDQAGTGTARGIYISPGNSVTRFLSYIYPNTDALYALGHSTLRWRQGFFGGVAAEVPLVVTAHASQTANLIEWQNSSGTPLSRIKADGRFRNDGATTWDDHRVDLITSTLGTLNPPVFTKVLDNGAGSEGVWAYAFNDAGTSGNEKAVLFNAQLPHNWKEGTAVHPHIHWMPATAAAGNVKWGLEYTMQNIDGGAFPTTTIITGTAQAAGGVALAHKVQELGVITMSGKAISCVFMCRIFRNSSDASDTYAADVYGLYVDFHYEVDSLGSDAEYTK